MSLMDSPRSLRGKEVSELSILNNLVKNKSKNASGRKKVLTTGNLEHDSLQYSLSLSYVFLFGAFSQGDWLIY